MAEVSKLGIRRPLVVSYSVTDLEEPPQHIGDELFQEKYRLAARLGVDFWSNKAQMQAKLAQAHKVLRANLFKDMLPLVEQIMLEADQPEVIEIAGALKQQMMEMEL